MFLYKGLFGYLNVNISKYVTFVCHGRTRLSNTSKYILKVKFVKLPLSNLLTIIELLRSGTLYVKTYVLTLCLVLVLSNLY